MEGLPKGLRVLLLDKDANYASEVRLKLEGMNYIVSMFCDEDEAISAALSSSNSDTFHVAIVEAYNAGENAPDELPSLVKELVPPLVKGVEVRNEFLEELELPCLSDSNCDDDKYPAPSTPQLKRVRSVDHTACQNQTNRSTGNDSAEHCEESKSVETTCFNKAFDMPAETDHQMHESAIKEENDSAYGCKSESDTSPQHKKQPEMETSSPGRRTEIQNTWSDSGGTSTAKINRKKMKVDWTSNLHKKFVQDVEQLGIDQAIPSRILELMGVEGLTRHNVASHLQKYRMHRRHALPKREERKLSLRPKDTMQSSYYYQHMPIMGYPPLQQPYNSNQTVVGKQAAYPMWLHTGSHKAALSAWGPPYQTWPWKSHTAMQAEAWGCPVILPHGSYSYYPQIYDRVEDFARNMPWNFHKDHQLAEEVIDKTVKEALSKPWLPLPIGLKPPSTESILSKLSKQGILNIPPPSS